MNLLMKGAALAPPFSCTTKYSSDVYSPRPPDIRVRLLPTKPPVHFTTEQPGRDNMGLPFSSLPTVTITRKGFFRLRFFILLICPNPFGSRFLLLFLLLGFRAGAPSCNGYPQCGHDKALSLTCSSHSWHFMSIIFTFYFS